MAKPVLAIMARSTCAGIVTTPAVGNAGRLGKLERAMPTILVLERPQRMLTQWFSSSLMVMSASGSKLYVVVEFARRNRARAFFLHLGAAGGTQAEIKISRGEGKFVAGGFKQVIGKNRNGGLALDHALGRSEFTQQLELC